MIASGASGTLGYLDQLQDALDAVYGSTFTFTLEILLGILAALTAIGGLGVIIGGWILTTDRVEIGRILMRYSTKNEFVFPILENGLPPLTVRY